MHINAGSEQNTQSIGKLLNAIGSQPECVKEFGLWGLKISTEMLLVRDWSSSWLLPLNKYIYSFSLSSAASIVFLPFRWKVELCSQKPSAWSHHPSPLAVTHAGRTMLSGTPASVVWVPTENYDLLLSWLNWYVCVIIMFAVLFHTWPLLYSENDWVFGLLSTKLLLCRVA